MYKSLCEILRPLLAALKLQFPVDQLFPESVAGFRGGTIGGFRGAMASQDAKSRHLPCLAYAVHYGLEVAKNASANPLSRHK